MFRQDEPIVEYAHSTYYFEYLPTKKPAIRPGPTIKPPPVIAGNSTLSRSHFLDQRKRARATWSCPGP